MPKITGYKNKMRSGGGKRVGYMNKKKKSGKMSMSKMGRTTN